ncbi:MAG: DNA helicase RecQ [Chloroflexota bacterium]|nr:DNA helicase RecQ [Chloroflexota bacterium]MDE2968666.1 DNA helicase RecQ [Chloroflexota bacterium]
MTTATDIHALLKAHFGFDTFRGQQEAVVRRVLAGGDALLLMPTGGGKSLCYQLPALAMDGVTLVVSPLIALMKDQVDGLNANGIAARFINSTLPLRDVERVQAEVRRGAVKILYVAPERLAVEGFRRFLSGLTVSLIAIDEAHCISEWGHEFRPDYRNLRPLREMFPNAPVLALTATATERVRRDIMEQLGLKGAEVFVSSFNRANLTYSVQSKDSVEQQLPRLLSKWQGSPAIVYCYSRQETEDVASALRVRGWTARPYHAGLSAEERRRTQEDFSRDRVPIIVATIAFGMGGDKPDVRLVVHTSLPKSVESYYQETGRAGRDGLPSECVLLYSYGDKARQEYFIRQLEDEGERRNAQAKLDQMVRFAQLHTCRRRYLLEYFGERWDADDCGGCDVCLASQDRGEFDATEIAQKALSAVVRTGERYGETHITGVLVGSKEKRILAADHDNLSVYGIVRDFDRNQLREVLGLLRARGLLALNEGEYPTLRVTDAGREFLQNRSPLSLPRLRAEGKPASRAPEMKPSAGAPLEYDEDLFEELRALRRRIADEQDVPAFVVFGDVALRHMAARRPETLQAFERVPGVGQAKLAAYGAAFTEAIRRYADEHGLPARASVNMGGSSSGRRGATYEKTWEMLAQGLSVEAVARERELAPGTVIRHIEVLTMQGKSIDITSLLPSPERRRDIEEAFKRLGYAQLGPVRESLGDEYSYEDLTIVRTWLRQQGRLPKG